MKQKTKLGLYVDQQTIERIEELCKKSYLSKSGLFSLLVDREFENQSIQNRDQEQSTTTT